METTTLSSKVLGLIPAIAFGVAHLSAPSVFAQDEEEEEDIYILSPFRVDASEQRGYRAINTLAGTRIKTNLKDLGSSISVVTAEFLEDTGATGLEDLLVYTPSTEIGGAYGNFAGPSAAGGDEIGNNDARADPITNNRVRGLTAASMTRDYFLSAMGFDGYNTERVTISRGPNSILFGIGEPAGIIDHTLKKAVLGRDLNKFSVRFGSHGTYRGTLDVNRALVKDRLALRLNAMHEDIAFRQEPAYEEDTRYYLAANAVLFTNDGVQWLDRTKLRASWEQAEIRGTPPNMIPPRDHFSHWWRAGGSAEADAITGIKPPVPNWPDDWRSKYGVAPQWTINAIYPSENDPGWKAPVPLLWNSYAVIYANPTGGPTVGFPDAIDSNTGENWSGVQVIHGQSGKFTLPNGTTTPDTFLTWATAPAGAAWYGFGFESHVIMDKNILDWEKLLLQGTSQFSNHDLDAYNVAIEQTFFHGKAGIELVFDSQKRKNSKFFPFTGGVRIDTSVYLPNGALNPNVGRPMVKTTWNNPPVDQYASIDNSWLDYETKRATGFYELDFTENDGWSKWLGKHTFTGLYSEWEQDHRDVAEALAWDTGHDKDQNYREIIDSPGEMRAWAYVGDAQWDAKNPEDMRLYTQPLQLELPKVGDFYNNFYFDPPSVENRKIHQSTVRVRSLPLWPGHSRQEVDSRALTLQSRLLDDHLVLTYGTRADHSKTWQNKGIDKPDGSFLVDESWDNWRHGDTEDVRPWADGPDPVLDASGDTATTQAVLHMPLRWTNGFAGRPTFSFHWSESENFKPGEVRRDIYNRVIPPHSGETAEYGFSVGLLEDRLNFRFNWYETSSANFENRNIQNSMWGFHGWIWVYATRWLYSKNAWINGAGPSFEEIGFGDPLQDGYPFPYDPTLIGDYTSYDEVINTLLYKVMPQETIDAFNDRIIGDPGTQNIAEDGIEGLNSVADLVSDGFEVEATLNITPNWRMTFNATKSESLFSNGLQQLTPYTEFVTANLKSLGLWDMSQGGWLNMRRLGESWTGSQTYSLASAASKEGVVSKELRKWRWNLVTNYDFNDGRFKGLGVGGSLRWQDKVAAGYPLLRNDLNILVPDLDKPFMGSDEMTGDLWFSYETQLREKTKVKFQLNLVNVLGDSDPLVVAINPDGQTAIIRASPEKRWFFTTTFEF